MKAMFNLRIFLNKYAVNIHANMLHTLQSGDIIY